MKALRISLANAAGATLSSDITSPPAIQPHAEIGTISTAITTSVTLGAGVYASTRR